MQKTEITAMWQIQIQSAAVYRREERNHYRTPCASIGLILSGLRRMSVLGLELENPGPFCLLQPAGSDIRFHFTPERENIAVLLASAPITVSDRIGHVRLIYGDDVIDLPAVTPIPPARLPGWREELQRIVQAHQSPTPRDRLRAELGVMSVLRWLLDADADALAASPAEDFKRRIDADTAHQQPLAEHAAACGYSADHLRLLFQDQYGVSPQAYRQRRRLARAMELIANSRLSVKEIAAACGFSHAAHFSNHCRAELGLSPRQAIARYRHGQA